MATLKLYNALYTSLYNNHFVFTNISSWTLFRILINFFTRKPMYIFKKYRNSIILKASTFIAIIFENRAGSVKFRGNSLRDRERERALYKVKRVSYACLMARWNGTFDVIQSSYLRLEFRVRFPYISLLSPVHPCSLQRLLIRTSISPRLRKRIVRLRAKLFNYFWRTSRAFDRQ